MAIVVHVEKEIQRTKQHSVNYLLEDDSTGEVRFNPQILRGDDIGDAAGFGATNATALYAAGTTVADGQTRIDKIRDKTTDDLRKQALQRIRKGVRDEETLAQILSAVNTIYADETGIVNFLDDLVTIYTTATVLHQNRFKILMFYLLFAGD